MKKFVNEALLTPSVTVPMLALIAYIGYLMVTNVPSLHANEPFCPTVEDASAAIGANLEKIQDEPCGFKYPYTEPVVFTVPSGWFASILEASDRLVLQGGEGQHVKAPSGSFRPASGNPDLDICLQFFREQEYAQSTEQPYTVFYRRVAGSPECQGANFVDLTSDDYELFEGWNRIIWKGATVEGQETVQAKIQEFMLPASWDTVAFFDGFNWLSIYRNPPLPSFQTLDSLVLGQEYWIFVTEDSTLAFCLQDVSLITAHIGGDAAHWSQESATSWHFFNPDVAVELRAPFHGVVDVAADTWITDGATFVTQAATYHCFNTR